MSEISTAIKNVKRKAMIFLSDGGLREMKSKAGHYPLSPPPIITNSIRPMWVVHLCILFQSIFVLFFNSFRGLRHAWYINGSFLSTKSVMLSEFLDTSPCSRPSWASTLYSTQSQPLGWTLDWCACSMPSTMVLWPEILQKFAQKKWQQILVNDFLKYS